MKKIVYTTMVALLLVACSKESDDTGSGTGGGGESGGVTEVTPVTSDLTVNLTTDKACYLPGESVSFTADALPAGAKIRYRTMDKVVSEQAAVGTTWTWTAPATDYTGYLVDVYRTKENGTEVILGTIAVDVSSDWTRFPRYGFVATFDASKKMDGVIEKEMAFLNRCHINGVQFQDWHNKHHYRWAVRVSIWTRSIRTLPTGRSIPR